MLMKNHAKVEHCMPACIIIVNHLNRGKHVYIYVTVLMCMCMAIQLSQNLTSKIVKYKCEHVAHVYSTSLDVLMTAIIYVVQRFCIGV